jgi:hypothetical protein
MVRFIALSFGPSEASSTELASSQNANGRESLKILLLTVLITQMKKLRSGQIIDFPLTLNQKQNPEAENKFPRIYFFLTTLVLIKA